MDAILEVKDLSVAFDTYAGEVKAVQEVSFSVAPGEAIGIVGESGCGKSVTAHSIMGLIPSPPGRIAQGEILFNNVDLLQLSDKAMEKIRGNDIGMIFQDPMSSLNPVLTIGTQLMETLQLHKKMSPQEAKKKAIEMLSLVGIPVPEKRIEEYPHQFSGGMRQRAMIAMALACNPKLLIADEPTTALDVTIQAQILDLIKKLNTEFNTSVIMISHDLGVIASLCSRVIVMYAGRIAEIGSVLDVFKNPQHPYTWGLLKSLPRMDVFTKEPLAVIDGHPPDLLNPPTGCPFYPRCPHAMQVCTEYYPEDTMITHQHMTRCWLQHANAPQHGREVTV